jgi:hypothetical protein
MNYESWIQSIENCLSFGLWMNERQTDEELDKGETKVKNEQGWNKPDGYALSSWLMAIEKRNDISREQIIEFVSEFLRPRIANYKNTQWKEYAKEKTPAFDMSKHNAATRKDFVFMYNTSTWQYAMFVYNGEIIWTPSKKRAQIFTHEEAKHIVGLNENIGLMNMSGIRNKKRKRLGTDLNSCAYEYGDVVTEHDNGVVIYTPWGSVPKYLVKCKNGEEVLTSTTRDAVDFLNKKMATLF